MARTQAADYDKRRAAIMKAASALYAKHGFHATSVMDIAAATKTSKALLYHYFPSKAEILFEVMDSHIRTLVEAAQTVVEGEGDAGSKLRAIGQELMRLYQGAADYHKVLVHELDSLPKARRAELVEHQRELIDMVDRLMVKVRPDLLHKKGMRRTAVMLYFGMLNWTHTWFKPHGALDGKRVAEIASEMFILGTPRQ